MPRILVTGGSGFIGNKLSEKLVESGNEVIVFDLKKPQLEGCEFIHGAIIDKGAVHDAVKECDFVFHLAAVMGTSELLNFSDKAVRINIEGTVNVLEACRRNTKPMILLSKPNIWLNTYTITKSAAEQFVHMYQEIFSVEAAIVKLFNVYGPGEPAGEYAEYRKAVPTFILNGLAGLDIEVYGNGEQTADFLYVADAVEALIAVWKNWEKCEGKILEAGTGISVSVNTLANIVWKLTGCKSKITHLPMRQVEKECSTIVSNTDLITKLTGWKPTKSLEDGLIETVEWYERQ